MTEEKAGAETRSKAMDWLAEGRTPGPLDLTPFIIDEGPLMLRVQYEPSGKLRILGYWRPPSPSPRPAAAKP